MLHGERYTLRHALMAEAVHDDLLPGERAELHRALARRAVGDPTGPETGAQRAAAIAHHYLAAGDQPAALAAAVRAGMAAMDVQAYRRGRDAVRARARAVGPRAGRGRADRQPTRSTCSSAPPAATSTRTTRAARSRSRGAR